LRQPRFFDGAMRTVKEYHEKVEYIHTQSAARRIGRPPPGLAIIEL
jgi:hypothetical protein